MGPASRVFDHGEGDYPPAMERRRAVSRPDAPAVGAIDSTNHRCNTVGLKATLLTRNRIAHADEAFAEVVVWKVPQPLPGSPHLYKYRLAFVDRGICVIRFDNEAGKGDHFHLGDVETRYRFSSLDRLFDDFDRAIRRYKR
jgi:hypothetical protein